MIYKPYPFSLEFFVTYLVDVFADIDINKSQMSFRTQKYWYWYLFLFPTQIKQVLERGIRGDTYQDGHGVGLAIVRDLVESYQGTFDISYSQKLTGAKCTLHFTGY